MQTDRQTCVHTCMYSSPHTGLERRVLFRALDGTMRIVHLIYSHMPDGQQTLVFLVDITDHIQATQNLQAKAFINHALHSSLGIRSSVSAAASASSPADKDGAHVFSP